MQKTTITATITFDVVTEDDAELDSIFEDIHRDVGIMMVDYDREGSVELAWQTVKADTTAPPAGGDQDG